MAGRRCDDACAFDEVHLPGTPGCARLGTGLVDRIPITFDPARRIFTYVYKVGSYARPAR